MRDSLQFHTSEDEAEQECARMCRRGQVEAVLTEDIDALVFGAPVVIRGITTMEPSVLRLGDILRGLEMTPEMFLDVCILSGSDFTPKPAGFGPATSVKALAKYKTLVNMCMHP
jgi:flap endonuclease-1